MKELVFLLEERSAQAMLESLLPRILSEGIEFRCISFEGKQDLEKQLPRKLRGYQNPLARFIVLRDLDGHPDCAVVKGRLIDLCSQSGKLEKSLIRLACKELEAFYLADLSAVEQALSLTGLSRHQTSRKFRTPDLLASPSRELITLTKQAYEKVAGSRAIGKHLNIENERSPSFRNLIEAIRRQERGLLVQTA